MCKAKSLAGLLYGNPSEEAVRIFSLSPEHKLETIQCDNVLLQFYECRQAYCAMQLLLVERTVTKQLPPP